MFNIISYLRFSKRPPGKKPPPMSEVDVFWDATSNKLIAQFDDSTTVPISGATIESVEGLEAALDGKQPLRAALTAYGVEGPVAIGVDDTLDLSDSAAEIIRVSTALPNIDVLYLPTGCKQVTLRFLSAFYFGPVGVDVEVGDVMVVADVDGSFYIVSHTKADGTPSGVTEPPERIVYTSSTCTSDSDLSLTSPVLGTDQTTALQAILDQAADGPLKIIWDGKYTTGRLRIRGNTHIEALPGCGAILKNAANTPLLENYNRTFAVDTVATGPDENIIIDGMTLHFNRTGQTQGSNATEGWIVGQRFVGVRNLKIRDCKLYKAKTFCSQVANCQDLVFENCYIDTDQNDTAQNHDGLHFHGPITNCVVRNTAGYSGDDIVSFVANDIGVRGPDQAQNMLGSLGQPYGEIRDILIDGLDLKFSNYGIRLLSSTSLMDRILIRGVTGYTRYHHWLIVGANLPAYGNPTGRGNFGTIMVEDCSAICADALVDEYIQLDGRINTVIFRNIKRHQSIFSPGGYATHVPTWRIETGANIGNLVIEGYSYTLRNDRYYKSTPTYTGAAQIHIENNGTIGKLDLINPSITRHWSGAADGTLIKNLGTIKLLNRTGVVAPNFATIVSDNAPVAENTGVADYLPALTSAWSGATIDMYAATLDGGYMDDIWDDSVLSLHYPFSQTEHAALGNDAFGGNVKITARLQFVTLPTTGWIGVVARATGITTSACAAGYALYLYAPSTTQVAFRLAYNGPSSSFVDGSDHVITTSALIPYDVELNCNGSTISAYVQRSTDGYYLTSANAWSATRQAFATGTNTTHAAVAGPHGVLNWQSNSTIGAKRSIQDFTVSAAT
jgi:hypothetical protein